MTKVSFTVNIIDDNILESNETFQLSINSSALPNRVTINNPSKVNVTIVDDDRKLLILCIMWFIQLIATAITVRFSPSTYSVNEDDGLVQPVLVLSNPSSTDITVQVRANDNTTTGKVVTL